MGLTLPHGPGIGCYASSRTMVEVPAAHFVPEAANPETTKLGVVCVTWQSRKKEVMTLLSYPHHPLSCEKKPFSYKSPGDCVLDSGMPLPPCRLRKGIVAYLSIWKYI